MTEAVSSREGRSEENVLESLLSIWYGELGKDQHIQTTAPAP